MELIGGKNTKKEEKNVSRTTTVGGGYKEAGKQLERKNKIESRDRDADMITSDEIISCDHGTS